MFEAVYYLLGEKSVRILNLAQAIEENRKIMVEIKLLDVDLPLNAVRNTSVIDLHREVSTFIKSAKFRVRWVGSFLKCLPF